MIDNKILEELSNEELEKLYEDTKKEMENRKSKREKELWENVVSAIKKYEKEVDCISVCGCGKEEMNLYTLDEPGYFYLYH